MRDLKLGESFTDPEVAALYRHRPPYSPEIFAILERLLVEPRMILDAGAGTGAPARAGDGDQVEPGGLDVPDAAEGHQPARLLRQVWASRPAPATSGWPTTRPTTGARTRPT